MRELENVAQACQGWGSHRAFAECAQGPRFDLKHLSNNNKKGKTLN